MQNPTIKISKELKEMLERIGSKGDSFDFIIKEILSQRETMRKTIHNLEYENKKIEEETMTTPKIKCKKCGYEGEQNPEIYGDLCQDCATIEYNKFQKDCFNNTELNKVKIVLCALWDNQPHPEAQKIIDNFKEEIYGSN